MILLVDAILTVESSLVAVGKHVRPPLNPSIARYSYPKSRYLHCDESRAPLSQPGKPVHADGQAQEGPATRGGREGRSSETKGSTGCTDGGSEHNGGPAEAREKGFSEREGVVAVGSTRLSQPRNTPKGAVVSSAMYTVEQTPPEV